MNIFEYLDYEQHDKVIKTINSGKFDINSTDESGTTLLMNCFSTKCTEQEQKIIDLLLSKNVNVNFQDEKYKYNALMLSCEINRFELTKKLLPFTDINAVNSEGKYALTLAVYHGRKDLIELFCMTAQSAQDVKKLREHLIFPEHSLTPYAHEFLDKIAFTFDLENNLLDKQVKNKKPKI